MDTPSDATPSEPRAAEAASTPRASGAASQVDDLVAAVRRLEAFAAQESQRVSSTLVPKLESNVRQNLWTSLLIALGVGVILGLLLGTGRRRG